MILIDDDRLLSGKNVVKDILITALEGLKKSSFIIKMNNDPSTIDTSISDLASLELFQLFSKTEYNFGSYFLLCEWMALNSYHFEEKKNGRKSFVFTRKNIVEENDRKEIYSSFKTFIERNPEVSTLFFKNQIDFPTNDKNVYVEKSVFNEFFKKSFDLFLKDTIEIKSLVKYSSHRSKFRKKMIDAWDIKICPYCNIFPLLSYDDNEKNTAEVDHFLSQAGFPLFGLSYGNYIVACSNCNQKFKNVEYSKLLNPRQHGFKPEVPFTHTNITYDSFYKPEVNEVEIKIENNCTDNDKREQIENSIINFKLRDCYEKNSGAKIEVCDIYRSINTWYDLFYLNKTEEYVNLQKTNIYERLKDFIIDKQYLVERNYPPSSDMINRSYGKLTSDTLASILKDYTRGAS